MFCNAAFRIVPASYQNISICVERSQVVTHEKSIPQRTPVARHCYEVCVGQSEAASVIAPPAAHSEQRQVTANKFLFMPTEVL